MRGEIKSVCLQPQFQKYWNKEILKQGKLWCLDKYEHAITMCYCVETLRLFVSRHCSRMWSYYCRRAVTEFSWIVSSKQCEFVCTWEKMCVSGWYEWEMLCMNSCKTLEFGVTDTESWCCTLFIRKTLHHSILCSGVSLQGVWVSISCAECYVHVCVEYTFNVCCIQNGPKNLRKFIIPWNVIYVWFLEV